MPDPTPAYAAPKAPSGLPVPCRWGVRLLGAVQLADGAVRIDHFATRAVATLLARLALAPERAHSREELVELLWPGVALNIGRNRLRQALSTLKGLLEAPGAAAVLLADRMTIRVVSGCLDCDVVRFEACMRQGDAAGAAALYRGDLMPGYYDEWVQAERARLLALHERLAGVDLAGHSAAGVATADGTSTPQPALPPPLPSGLPSFWTRNIGAELTASRLRVLVCAQRLVTVHGPGGSGKTRLAVDVATALRDAHDPRSDAAKLPQAMPDAGAAMSFDLVVFVPLVDCVSAAQTLDKVCAALHSPGQGSAHARIVAALTGSQTLLVLDNTEQLEADTAMHIAALLRELPALHVLVTSRRLLEVDGEHAFELGGLALPPADASLADAVTNPAVQLFVDRSRAARADFHLNEVNFEAVAGLVRLLGGMPLAIELAASRMRVLGAQDLLQRLSVSAGTPMLDLLTRSAAYTTPGSRHASMRHVVDWSWRQLTLAQRGLLQAMSVFGAAASVDAIAAVAGVPRPQAEVSLDELQLASLVISPARSGAAGPGSAEARFSLLQPVREFAAASCDASAERQARGRLREWLIGFARQALPLGPTAVAVELPHVHAALTSAVADGDGAQALALATLLRPYWDADDLPSASLLALEQALPQARDPDQRADAHELLSLGFGNAGHATQALAHAKAAIAAARDDRRRALALARFAFAEYAAGQFEVGDIMRALDEAHCLAQRSGDMLARATVLRVQAVVVSNLQLDFARSEQLAAEGQALWENLGHRANARTMLMGRVIMAAWQGRNEEALPVLQRCELDAAADGDWVGALHGARQIGRVHIRLRQWPQAAAALRRGVRLGWQRRYARGLANALINLPEALLMSGQPEAAATLHGFAMAHWTRLYGQPNRIEAAETKRTRRLLRLALGAARVDQLRTQGQGLALPVAVAMALDTEAA